MFAQPTADGEGADRIRHACLFVREAVGGEPQHESLLFEIGEEALTLVHEGGCLSGHGPIIAD
jgi:hypothetical protein